MSFTIVTILFTLLAGIAGSRLANHYSVYALVPVTFFFLALAAAGCVAYGATLFGRVCRVVWRDWTAIRLFASALRTKRAPAGCYVLWFEARTPRPSTATPTWRSRSGCPAVRSAQRRLMKPQSRRQQWPD